MDLGIAVVGPRWTPPRAAYITPPNWQPAGESLWCSLNKLAALNHFTPSEIRRNFLEDNPGRPTVSFNGGSAWDMDAIADALGISEDGVELGLVASCAPSHWPSHDSDCRHMSSASTSLRYCRQCLSNGFHSPLHQLRRLDRCPWHGKKLRTACPKCGESVEYVMSKSIPWHRFACRCGLQWPLEQMTQAISLPEYRNLANYTRAYQSRVQRVRCADSTRANWRRSKRQSDATDGDHRFIDSLMEGEACPRESSLPLHGRLVAEWCEGDESQFARVGNDIANDVLNGWIVAEDEGGDGQRGISLMYDAVTRFRRMRHFIRRNFINRSGLHSPSPLGSACIDWTKKRVVVGDHFDCRQKAYFIWLATNPMFLPIEDRVDPARDPWAFGFSRREFLQYWLDLAASVIVNSGYEMTLRLPIARWLLRGTLPIGLFHRYMNWLRRCAGQCFDSQFRFDEWRPERLGTKHQLLVASSEERPPQIYEFSESRIPADARRILTGRADHKPTGVEMQSSAHDIYAAIDKTLFRL